MVPLDLQETYQVIELSNITGARCLDGTPYKFYFTRGKGSGLNKFMFFFRGAGYCGADGDTFLSSCYSRISTEFGSSSTWGPNGTNMTLTESIGYFSSNESHNPKFWNWNKININYCDGSNNQGYLEEPVEYNGTLLWFRGYNNTLAVFDYVKTHFNLFDAKEIVMAGSSSGAVSAMMYVQYVQTYLPNKQIKLSVLSDGGLFMDAYNELASCYLYRYNMQVLANFTQSKTLELFKTCEFYNSSEVWKCLTPQYFYKKIENPVFLANAIYDCDEMATTYGIPCVVYGADTCDLAEKTRIVSLQEKVYEVVLEIRKNKQFWGFFTRSCFEHMYYNTWAWYGETMNVFNAETLESRSFRYAYYEWYERIEQNFSKSSYIDLEDGFHNPFCIRFKGIQNMA